MSKKKRKQKAQQLAALEEVYHEPQIDWNLLKPFNSSEARRWAEKNAGKVIHVDHRIFELGGVYIENGKLYFWVDPYGSQRSWFRIDSKIARYLKHNFWEEV